MNLLRYIAFQYHQNFNIYLYVCSTCINTHVLVDMWTGAVNVGLLHYWEGSLVTLHWRSVRGLAAGISLQVSLLWRRESVCWALGRGGGRALGCGAPRSSVLLQQWLAQLEGCSPVGIAIRTDAKNHMQATEARGETRKAKGTVNIDRKG